MPVKSGGERLERFFGGSWRGLVINAVNEKIPLPETVIRSEATVLAKGKGVREEHETFRETVFPFFQEKRCGVS